MVTEALVAGVVVPHDEPWLEVVRKQLNGLKFGTVQITVHEGRVVQVETNVKIRFQKTS